MLSTHTYNFSHGADTQKELRKFLMNYQWLKIEKIPISKLQWPMYWKIQISKQKCQIKLKIQMTKDECRKLWQEAHEFTLIFSSILRSKKSLDIWALIIDLTFGFKRIETRGLGTGHFMKIVTLIGNCKIVNWKLFSVRRQDWDNTVWVD